MSALCRAARVRLSQTLSLPSLPRCARASLPNPLLALTAALRARVSPKGREGEREWQGSDEQERAFSWVASAGQNQRGRKQKV